MNDSINKIYEFHHLNNRQSDFSIFEEERGKLLKDIIGENKMILDLGCRDGALTKYFVNGNNVVGVDVDRNSLQKIKNNLSIETIEMDLNGSWQELGEKKFNVIVAGEILEHLYFPDIVTKKVYDHLQPKGIFLGSIPNAFSLKNRIRYSFGNKKNTPLSDPTHINQFTYSEIYNLLKSQFSEVNIIGLGRYKSLIKIKPAWFAFMLFFIAKK